MAPIPAEWINAGAIIDDGDGWILNGTKRWITNGSIAGVAIVWAKVDEGIAGFLVEKAVHPGILDSTTSSMENILDDARRSPSGAEQRGRANSEDCASAAAAR